MALGDRALAGAWEWHLAPSPLLSSPLCIRSLHLLPDPVPSWCAHHMRGTRAKAFLPHEALGWGVRGLGLILCTCAAPEGQFQLFLRGLRELNFL